MIRLIVVLLLLALPVSAQIYGDRRVPLMAVAEVDLGRYAGRWYGIARMPNRFERGCAGVTADYAVLADGRLGVTNACRDAATGRARSVSGTARLVGPGQLAVRFGSVPFVAGDYVILHVGPRYELAVVGEPRRRYAWVLARRPSISAADWDRALAVLQRNGYRTEALERIVQP